MNLVRTAMLLAALTAIFMGVGYLIGGQSGMLIAFVFAAGMNLFSYWNSDAIVLRMQNAVEVDARTAPEYYAIVARLAREAGLRMPRVYVVESGQPNAFATGRDPAHAAVCATTGLLAALSADELAAVMAHELGHVRNRDTLTMTIAATIAGAVSMLANFAFFFGGDRRDGNNPLGFVGVLLAAIFAPIAAALVQMAVSRTREYAADRASAELTRRPDWLISALTKIARGAERTVNVEAENHPATAPMFIINPLHGAGFDNLFATHPSTESRIAALRDLMGEVGAAGPPRRVDLPRVGTSPRPRGPWN